MKKTRFTKAQMVGMLQEADARPAPEMAKKPGVSALAISRWRTSVGTLLSLRDSSCRRNLAPASR